MLRWVPDEVEAHSWSTEWSTEDVVVRWSPDFPHPRGRVDSMSRTVPGLWEGSGAPGAQRIPGSSHIYQEPGALRSVELVRSVELEPLGLPASSWVLPGSGGVVASYMRSFRSLLGQKRQRHRGDEDA